MTDEGRVGDPIDDVEALNAMIGFAKSARTLYDSLREQEFSSSESLKLVGQWMHGIATGMAQQ